jgi:trans-aconitate methyltransferase
LLEIGCGNGALLYCLREKLNFKNITGIDLSPVDIARAREKLPDVELLCCDANDYLEQNKNVFDFIILKAVLEHIPKENILPFLCLLNESLTEQGVVIVDVPNMDWILSGHERYMDFTHEVGFTRESLGQVMRNVFSEVRVKRGKAVRPAAFKHSFANKVCELVIVPGVNFLFKFLRQGEADTW